MKKEYRIKKNEDFQSIIKKKKSVANRQFVVYCAPSQEHLRVGISVSKKLGHAVVRNKIKRQVRMMVQQVFDKDQKMDFIIIVRYNYLNCSYQDNLKSLISLYNKISRRMEK
ncbi:ribonuclease P protein component [Allocoprobacillus halotolerans]|uniref:Ribonuclease P protein component n=1 Tax=Allocoprobacillus halotolerans TaxID=2944914 RepID=A0ABY5I904_9FIRM|nr:ribonuclease P protein component [Allocoprobacillus halotolerans]UTY40410.1 ribonuclease P protein component [Allocoprobacillus halotolerans]